MGQGFNIQISQVFCPTLLLGGMYQIFLGKCWKKMIKICDPLFFFLHFYHRKLRKYFFSSFYNKKVKYLKNDCSQLSFEVYNVCVAQKLQISEFWSNFFSIGPWPLRRPPEACNFNLSNLNSVSNFSKRPQLSYEILFVALEWNWEELYYVFPKRDDSNPPHPMYLGDQKAHVF